MVECGGLLNRCTGKTVPGVRIPPAPVEIRIFACSQPEGPELDPLSNSLDAMAMQKTILWILSGAVSLLLLVNLLLGLGTRKTVSQIQMVQAQVANGGQLEMVLRNLSIRIAMAGEKDPAFKEILKKHELNVKLDAGTDTK